LRCGLKVARTTRHFHPTPPWPRLPLPRPQSHPDPVPTSRFRPGIPDRRIGPGSDARSWKLISWRRKSTRMACFSSKIFYSAPSATNNSKKLSWASRAGGSRGSSGGGGAELLLVAALDVALLKAAWRWWEPDPPAASPGVRLRHGAKVFPFLSVMRAPKRTEPVRELWGQLHSGHARPISGEF
jgi:hypothetical protein